MNPLASIFKSGRLRSYPKGQILLYQGETTRDMFYILKGYVKVYDITSQGIEKLLLILGPNHIYPILCTFDRPGPLMNFFETFTKAEILVLPQAKLLDEINKNHDLSIFMLRYYTSQAREMMVRMGTIESASARHKILQVLSYLMAIHGEVINTTDCRVKFTITQQAIADMAGITRETASIQLNELEDAKAFRIINSHLVINIKNLEKLIESS